MIFAALASLGYAWLLGAMCVAVLWPRTRSLQTDLPLILPLGLGIGFGITSVLFFLASLIAAKPLPLVVGMELVLGGGLGWVLWRRDAFAPAGTATAEGRHSWWSTILISIFAQAAMIAAVVSLRAWRSEPHGGWDGWAIWNMHARFMARGGETWANVLPAPQLVWTHPDYPLLVSASVARAWAYAGQEAPFIGGIVSAAFAVATAWLLFVAIDRLRDRAVACVGGLLLLGTPFFLTFSSNQHADIPLGFFILAPMALMAVSRHLPGLPGLPALAGICAGMAAWTKNEGLLFALVAAGAWCFLALGREGRRPAVAFLAALAVALLPVLHFKMALAPGSDLLSGELAGHLGRMSDWSRHRLILSSLGRDLLHFGEWRFVPYLAMALPLIGPGWRRLTRAEWMAAAIVVLMTAGYYAVYLLTSSDLAWHLDSSLVRLLLQLWPAALFFWCLAVTADTSPDIALAGVSEVRRRAALALLVGINLAAAGGIAMAFSRQLAPNEFDRVRVSGARVSLVVGEGWFSLEDDGRNRWVWSRGRSTLLFQVSAAEPATVTLRFGIRGLGMRTVTATLEDRVVWQAAVGEPLVDVTIPNLALRLGNTEIVFSTDVPGVPESADPGARDLTFALYDLQLE